MSWAKVDDKLHSHPKARRAGLPALGLHLLAMSYCADHLTDGFIDDEWVEERTRGKGRQLADRLADVGLWEAVRGGYRIRNLRLGHGVAEYRRHRLSHAGGHATAPQVRARIAFYGGRCWVCGATYDAIDHVKPIAAGGGGYPANLRPICTPCNSRKGAKWPYSVTK